MAYPQPPPPPDGTQPIGWPPPVNPPSAPVPYPADAPLPPPRETFPTVTAHPTGPDPFFAPPPPPRWSTAKTTAVVVGAFLALFVFVTFVILPLSGRLFGPAPRSRPPSISLPEAPLVEPSLLPTLGIGQCLPDLSSSDPWNHVVPCKEKHAGEVFEIIPVGGTEYPGAKALNGEMANCKARLSAYAKAEKVATMQVYAAIPDEERWNAGDTMVYCIVGRRTEVTTGSVSKSAS